MKALFIQSWTDSISANQRDDGSKVAECADLAGQVHSVSQLSKSNSDSLLKDETVRRPQRPITSLRRLDLGVVPARELICAIELMQQTENVLSHAGRCETQNALNHATGASVPGQSKLYTKATAALALVPRYISSESNLLLQTDGQEHYTSLLRFTSTLHPTWMIRVATGQTSQLPLEDRSIDRTRSTPANDFQR
jgi:hypothetical protein